VDRKERLRRCRVLALAGLGILGAVAAVSFFSRLGYGIPCLFHRITGLLCPGCGNTRAALALLRLQFREAFSYNPLCLLEFLYIFQVLFCCARSYWKGGPFAYRPRRQWPDILILAVVLLWWILRNLLPSP